MNQNLLSEIQQNQAPSSISNHLKTERDFRFFLLLLVDHPELYPDLVTSVSSLYPSEFYRIKTEKRVKRPFKVLNDRFLNGEKPITYGSTLSEPERAEVINLLLPKEFVELKDSISKKKLTLNEFQTIAHTAAFFKSMENENAELEKQIRILQDVQQHNPDAQNVFIPPSSTRRPKSSVKARPKTALHTKIRQPSILSECESYPDTPSGNQSISQIIQDREAEILDAKKKEADICQQIQMKKSNITLIKRDIQELKALIQKAEEEKERQLKEQLILEQSEDDAIRAKKEEANLITRELKNAIRENIRLREILEQNK